MVALPELSIYCHQDAITLSDKLLGSLMKAGQNSISLALQCAACDDSALSLLDEVEVSIIDDDTIADVHLRFMDIPGATDVITFDHGEIHISAETAESHAREYGSDTESELMLYIIHGLLHLAGHEDATESGKATMDRLQQEILIQVWKS